MIMETDKYQICCWKAGDPGEQMCSSSLSPGEPGDLIISVSVQKLDSGNDNVSVQVQNQKRPMS
jgi:hypothetical protein